MRRWFLALVFSLAASSVFAQGIDVRFYVVPKVGTGVKGDPFRPKYTRDEAATGPFDWSQMDYGAESTVLLAAQVTTAQHNALAAQTDVLSVPTPIDSNVSGAALPTVQAKLEAVNIPGNWVSTSNTYRDVLRAVGKAIQVLQRYHGLFGDTRLFEPGVTLATQWNQMSTAQKNRLIAVANDMSLDTSGITNQMTLRQIIKAVADQLPVFSMEGVTF